MEQVEDVSERQWFEREIDYLTGHDALTGLLNRRRLAEEVSAEMGRVGRRGGDGALLMIDIDNFKYVNDTLGYRAGDEVIRTIAEALANELSDDLPLARIGGDEYAVLLPDAKEPEARATAERLLGAVRRARPQLDHGTPVTISIGVSCLGMSAALLTWDEVLADAAVALYAAKQAGRDRAVVYGPTVAEATRLHERATWHDRIHDALRNDGFVLYAQPIVEVSSGSVLAHELLLRMRGDRGELYQPAAFMPSINDPGFAEFTAQEVDRCAIDPSGLIFEITEPPPSPT